MREIFKSKTLFTDFIASTKYFFILFLSVAVCRYLSSYCTLQTSSSHAIDKFRFKVNLYNHGRILINFNNIDENIEEIFVNENTHAAKVNPDASPGSHNTCRFYYSKSQIPSS